MLRQFAPLQLNAKVLMIGLWWHWVCPMLCLHFFGLLIAKKTVVDCFSRYPFECRKI
jgi:hypothetical protein